MYILLSIYNTKWYINIFWVYNTMNCKLLIPAMVEQLLWWMTRRVNMVQFELVGTTTFLFWASVSGWNHSSKMSRIAVLLSLAAISGILTLLAAFWFGRPDVQQHSQLSSPWCIQNMAHSDELSNLQAPNVDPCRAGILANDSWAAEQGTTRNQAISKCSSIAKAGKMAPQETSGPVGNPLEKTVWKALQRCSDRFQMLDF